MQYHKEKKWTCSRLYSVGCNFLPYTYILVGDIDTDDGTKRHSHQEDGLEKTR